MIIGSLVLAKDDLFIGVNLPGEADAISGGVLASQQHSQLWQVIALVAIVAISGDSVAYRIGCRFGPRMLAFPLRQSAGEELVRPLRSWRAREEPYPGSILAFFREVMPARRDCPACLTVDFWPSHVAGRAVCRVARGVVVTGGGRRGRPRRHCMCHRGQNHRI